MENSTGAKSKTASDQPYVEVSQVDDDPTPGKQDAEPSPESGDSSQEEDKHHDPGPPDGTPVVLGTRARLWTSLVHVLPLAVSALLIVINIQRWYWFEEEGPIPLRLKPDVTANSIRNMLQLVAKIYELLVIASLGALTIKVFKRQLVESALPLGLLTGAYRVGDVPYIFSGFFWRGITPYSFFLALLLFINTMLATLVGPSSAILLVPELDWYPIPGAFSNLQYPVFHYNVPVDRAWPRVLSAPRDEFRDLSDGCDGVGNWLPYWCPSAGFADLYNWLAEWDSSDLNYDLLTQDPTGVVRRRLCAKGDPTYHSDYMAVTTTSMASLLTIGRLLNFMKWNNMGAISNATKFKLTTLGESTIFQPLVQSKCYAFLQSNFSTRVSSRYDLSLLKCLGDPVCEDMLNGQPYYYISDRPLW
jgi:hypothetical protein